MRNWTTTFNEATISPDEIYNMFRHNYDQAVRFWPADVCCVLIKGQGGQLGLLPGPVLWDSQRTDVFQYG
jgi:hypothetical protein